MRRKLLGGLATAAAVPVLLFGTQMAALAQTRSAGNGTQTAVPAQVPQCPPQYLSTGGIGDAEARLYCRVHYYGVQRVFEVQGWFHNDNANYSITGWVEQTPRPGRDPYKRITYLYPVNASYTAQTGWHEDEAPKLARACFQFSFSGAAIHCTPSR